MSATGREIILSAFETALEAVSPAAAVERSLHWDPSGAVIVDGEPIEAPAEILAIAIGKAAEPMMAGAISAIGESRIQRGFVLTKDRNDKAPFPARIEVHTAAHPVLDERSVAATRRLLEWVGEIEEDATVFCLISGGGSALLEAPVDGVSLSDFQEMTRILLRAGADIHQLNAVRSQISRVKGGGLRAAIPARRVVTLALSDVLDNDLRVIASGPTIPAGLTSRDALAVIADLGVSDSLPSAVVAALEREPGPRTSVNAEDMAAVIADNAGALSAAVAHLSSTGLNVRRDIEPKVGEAGEVARQWVRQLPDLPEEVDAVVAGGELTVTVRGDGIGGRNTEFALAAALELEALALGEWTVASLATDGQDAVTGATGAIVDASIPAQLRADGIDPLAALKDNDTFPGLSQIDAVVVTGPTGTNVNDLYFAIRNSGR